MPPLRQPPLHIQQTRTSPDSRMPHALLGGMLAALLVLTQPHPRSTKAAWPCFGQSIANYIQGRNTNKCLSPLSREHPPIPRNQGLSLRHVCRSAAKLPFARPCPALTWRCRSGTFSLSHRLSICSLCSSFRAVFNSHSSCANRQGANRQGANRQGGGWAFACVFEFYVRVR